MASRVRIKSLVAIVTVVTSLGCAGPDVMEQGHEEPIAPPVPYARPTYTKLSETGLFSSERANEIATGAMAFEPSFPLWSDGAEKRRWVALPAGATIDTADMDHWVPPIGTRFWKEFSLDGSRLETRMIERYGAGPDDYFMGSFLWNGDQSDADYTESEHLNVGGTAHDVPDSSACHMCHDGEAGRVLGFSALQLVDEAKPGARLRDLVANDRLSNPPQTTRSYAPPGDAVTRAALGYLHANCGHCHNPNGYCAYPGMQLRLSVEDTVPELTALFATVVGQPVLSPMKAAARVAPGSPGDSAIIERMGRRGDGQMPFLATELVDEVGVQAVSAWITALSH